MKLQTHRGLTVAAAAVMLSSVVMTVAAVMLSSGGRKVGGGAAADDMFMTKLPMPTQKAMARPASRPTTAPWHSEENMEEIKHPVGHLQRPDWTGRWRGAGLTVELAQGKNRPRQKRPSRGPPTIPKMLKAA